LKGGMDAALLSLALRFKAVLKARSGLIIKGTKDFFAFYL